MCLGFNLISILGLVIFVSCSVGVSEALVCVVTVSGLLFFSVVSVLGSMGFVQLSYRKSNKYKSKTPNIFWAQHKYTLFSLCNGKKPVPGSCKDSP